MRIAIEVPAHLTGGQKRALQAFAESCDGSNYPEAARMRKQVEVFMARRDTLKASS